ncbi:SAM-dependent methyltransferase [Actinobacillus equuli]|nr:SAM-dependent methyltransferase [Actinobacillus equuli]
MEQLDKIPEDNFDVVTSSFAFHYIEDFADLLAKFPQNDRLRHADFSQEHPIVTCYKDGYRWEKNEQKQQVAYRLNYYRDEGERDRSWFQQAFKTYHRTMATICNQLIQAGLKSCKWKSQCWRHNRNGITSLKIYNIVRHYCLLKRLRKVNRYFALLGGCFAAELC